MSTDVGHHDLEVTTRMVAATLGTTRRAPVADERAETRPDRRRVAAARRALRAYAPYAPTGPRRTDD